MLIAYSFHYDNANRLTDLVNKKSDTTIIADYYFTLDANGNRTQVVKNEPLLPNLNLSTIDYTYNLERNRLQTAGASSFTYDNEGQLATKDSSTYTFDYEHRLKSIGASTQFFYDGVGNRLKAVRNSVETRYIYDAGGNLLAEADNNNVITKYYIHGLGLLAMVTDTNNVYTYHYNAVGSTIAITDINENIINQYAYTPFGILANEEETISQPFKFVGQHGVMTEPNGFYYMRARYYDPQVGRFISEDPIGFDGGDVNLYVYVANNPVVFMDSDGLWKISFDLYALVGGGITIGGGDGQPLFISTRFGLGVGGGLSYDPEGSSPSSNPNSISDIGFAANASVGFLPLELGSGFNAGISHLPNERVRGYASDVNTRPVLSTGGLKFKANAYFATEATLYPTNIMNVGRGKSSKP